MVKRAVCILEGQKSMDKLVMQSTVEHRNNVHGHVQKAILNGVGVAICGGRAIGETSEKLGLNRRR